jgi:hypothetical protein
MLTGISWIDFFRVIIPLAAVYYLGYLYVFYREEILNILDNQERDRLKRLLTEQEYASETKNRGEGPINEISRQPVTIAPEAHSLNQNPPEREIQNYLHNPLPSFLDEKEPQPFLKGSETPSKTQKPEEDSIFPFILEPKKPIQITGFTFSNESRENPKKESTTNQELFQAVSQNPELPKEEFKKNELKKEEIQKGNIEEPISHLNSITTLPQSRPEYSLHGNTKITPETLDERKKKEDLQPEVEKEIFSFFTAPQNHPPTISPLEKAPSPKRRGKTVVQPEEEDYVKIPRKKKPPVEKTRIVLDFSAYNDPDLI